MLPALQPSRPKHPQQTSRPSFGQQQKRSVHEHPPLPPDLSSKEPPKSSTELVATRPRSQLEAMPPFGPTQTPFMPPRNMYDSAIRHPVFFTEQLRKPPFPIPQIPSYGFHPVACGYIMETKKATSDSLPKTKL